jgi:pimeloyl-ACP methyl ester carboxylesterase
MAATRRPTTDVRDAVLDLHGHDVAYRRAGSGPVVLLVHGIAGTNDVWDEVLPELATTHTVIAPDLPGHGRSGAAAGDYSVGAMAATLRDLVLALGIERVTVVGHSLGGGVAMQYSYLFPEHCERLVLVSAGGLGRSVALALRSAALPGSEVVTAGLGLAARVGGRVLGATGLVRPERVAAPTRELGRSVASLADRDTRTAFLATLRAVVGPVGQRVFAGDRLYLAAAMPTLIVWGERDPIIPVGHGRRAHAAMPGSRLEVLPGVGHFPPLEAPAELTAALRSFLDTTEPAVADPDRFRALLRDRTADGRPDAGQP